MAERVGKTLANYIGSFVEYDKNNNGSFWREYMRIRVRVDIRQPLKKDTRVKNQGGNWCTVNFKYEKLGVFCFVCGLIGHGENRCAIRFSMTEDDGSRAWSKELRAEPRRRNGRQTSRWLTEEDGGQTVHGEGQFHDHSGEQTHTTRSTNPETYNNSSRHTINLQSLPCPPLVPSITPTRQDLAHITFSQPIIQPAINANTDNGTQLDFHISSNPQQIIPAQHPLLTISALDNSLNNQSLPKNSIIPHSLPYHIQPTTSYSLSPSITDALKNIPPHQFSFTATHGPNPKQPINPLTKPGKSNPNQKPTRTGPVRTGPKHDPNNTETDPTQTLSAAMEVQTEKKKRRENEKEKEDDSTVVQHFLTAGPGSQACRDQ
jgi:hypothetical protein